MRSLVLTRLNLRSYPAQPGWAVLADEGDVLRFTRAHRVVAWAITADPDDEWKLACRVAN